MKCDKNVTVNSIININSNQSINRNFKFEYTLLLTLIMIFFSLNIYVYIKANIEFALKEKVFDFNFMNNHFLYQIIFLFYEQDYNDCLQNQFFSNCPKNSSFYDEFYAIFKNLMIVYVFNWQSIIASSMMIITYIGKIIKKI